MLPSPDPREIDRTARRQAPSVVPPTLPPQVRVRNFDEVHLPWTEEMVMTEAARCLHCPDRPCVTACPLGNDIPLALWLAEHGDFQGAAAVFEKTSHFSEILSRVCTQAQQCESACPQTDSGVPPVGIGAIERFLADRRRAEPVVTTLRPHCSGHRVAVVGAGPAGLTVAELLARKGHGVTVFDQWPAGGGMLRYGIPRFKLDHRLVVERMDLLRDLGVEFVFDTRIGREAGVADLFALGFEAVFLGTGAPKPIRPGIPGADLKGVLQAPSFLVQANVEQNLRPSDLEDPPVVGDTVVVIGGGDTAINCSRAALRLGASKVACLYRRGREEMSGNPRDHILATEEGVEFRWRVKPEEVLSDGEERVRGLRCVRTRDGPPDASGRPAVEPVPGSGFQIQANTVVFALGSGPDPTLTREISGLSEEETGFLKVDPATGRTGREMVWAGGENVTGPSPVAWAVAQGRAAAEDIHRRLCWRQ